LRHFEVPLQPMLGGLAVAPPFGMAPVSTGDTGRFGGNMDFNEVVEGATVYLPVYQPGALLYLGDAHARQGDGETSQYALETSMDVEFRIDVVRRRTAHRLRKAQDQLHLVLGLLTAILDIDEVIQLIRTSDDTATARTRLMSVFDLSELQANYILELQLRRLTKFSRLDLETQRDDLQKQIEELEAILGDEKLLHRTVSTELGEVAKKFGTPRRTVLLESAGNPVSAAAPLEVSDDPCWVLLSSTGLLARTSTDEPIPTEGGRAKHDAVIAAVRTTVRGEVGLVTSRGRMIRISALELPTLPPLGGAPSLSGGAPLAAYVDLPRGEEPVSIVSLAADGPGLALGTAQGVVKRVTADQPRSHDWEVISLKDGDRVVGAGQVVTGDEDLVFVTTDAQLLRFPASGVRPQGRTGGGIAGVRVTAGEQVAFFGVVDPTREAVVVTASGSADALPGTQPGALKVTPFSEYPAKGRGTGGVRAHRFLKGEDTLVLAWVGATPARASGPGGVALELPEANGRRDGSGVQGTAVITGIGPPLSCPEVRLRALLDDERQRVVPKGHEDAHAKGGRTAYAVVVRMPRRGFPEGRRVTRS
jgi:DNA gyrase subunit A